MCFFKNMVAECGVYFRKVVSIPARVAGMIVMRRLHVPLVGHHILVLVKVDLRAMGDVVLVS